MKKIVRFKKPKIGAKLATESVEIEAKSFPVSLTDDTYYVPSAEANKNIDKTKTMSHDPALYDMPEGKSEADFTKLAHIRKPGTDITMIQAEAQKMNEMAMQAIKKDAIDKTLESVKNAESRKVEISNIATKVANTVQNTSK